MDDFDAKKETKTCKKCGRELPIDEFEIIKPKEKKSHTEYQLVGIADIKEK